MINERVEDDILIIELDNGRDNSLTAEFFIKMGGIIKDVNSGDSPKGIIFTGKGNFFSSGFNLPMFLGFTALDEVVKFFNMEEEVLLDIFMCNKPVVAALNGHTVAGGLIISMACDYRIVKNHPKIKLGMSEIKIGLPLSITQGEIIRFGIGNDKNYRDLIYFGKMVDVNSAMGLGMVDEVVEGDQLIDRAKQVVSEFIDNPGRAFSPLKYLFRRPLADRIREGVEKENWQDGLNCLFKDDVRKTLEFVYASMLK